VTPREVRAQLERLGLSQSEAARLLGVHTPTMQRWCSDLRTQYRQIPAPAERLLYAMERLPELVGILEWYGPEKKRPKPAEKAARLPPKTAP